MRKLQLEGYKAFFKISEVVDGITKSFGDLKTKSLMNNPVSSMTKSLKNRDSSIPSMILPPASPPNLRSSKVFDNILKELKKISKTQKQLVKNTKPESGLSLREKMLESARGDSPKKEVTEITKEKEVSKVTNAVGLGSVIGSFIYGIVVDFVAKLKVAMKSIKFPGKTKLANFLVKLKIDEKFKTFATKIDTLATKIGTFFKNLGTKLDDFVKVLRLEKFLKAAKFLPKLLGKLFFPLQILLSAYDMVVGFIDGWKNSDAESLLGKFQEAYGSAIANVLENLIGVPLDLLKSGVAWIMGKMGFDGAKKTLESFSFAEQIDRLVKIPFDFVSNVIDYIYGIFTGKTDVLGDLANIGVAIDNMMRKIVKIILLTIKSKDIKVPGIGGLVQRIIPDFAYEYAGITRDGEDIPKTPTPTRKDNRTNEQFETVLLTAFKDPTYGVQDIRDMLVDTPEYRPAYRDLVAEGRLPSGLLPGESPVLMPNETIVTENKMLGSTTVQNVVVNNSSSSTTQAMQPAQYRINDRMRDSSRNELVRLENTQ